MQRRMDAPTLDYAPAPPLVRRRLFRHICCGTALAVAFAFGVKLLPLATRRFELIRAQDRCLTHEMPTEVKVNGKTPLIPPEWSALYTASAGNGLSSEGTVFLHERKTPSGARR